MLFNYTFSLRHFLGAAAIAGCFFLGLFFFMLEHDWVDFSVLTVGSKSQPSVVYDADGDEMIRFELDRREFVSFNQLPKVLIDAFVATEDHNFFSHSGISFKGIARSAIVNVYHWRKVQGASTITQQLARGLFLTYDRSFVRKIKEIFLSLQLERRFTKAQIFELYLNNMYFGRGIYGVEAACRRFWNKSVSDISLDQAATLAAVAKSARFFSPLNDPCNAKKRRNLTLQSMLKLGYINEQEFHRAVATVLQVQDHLPGNGVRLYIQEKIRQWAEQKWGKETLYQKGLKIKSTISTEKQSIAEELFCAKIKELRTSVGKEINGGMMAIEAHTGKIRACVGGYNFKESQFNRAFLAVRQMGSSFKPIVYSAALMAGIGFDTLMVDEPMEMMLPGCVEPWRPKNWTHTFDGTMTLARALAYSNNIIAIKTLLQVGIDPVIDLAHKFCLHRSLPPYPSLALGAAEATVEENVAAFNVFTNNGIYVKPYLIEWVKDGSGKKIWEYEGVGKRVIESSVASKVAHVLSLRLKTLRSSVGAKNWIDAQVIGKTGSTNGATSTWFVGATPELTTAVYIGRDDGKPMGTTVYGSQTAYPIWFEFNKRLKFSKKHFYVEPTLREIPINWLTGAPTSFVDGNECVTLLGN